MMKHGLILITAVFIGLLQAAAGDHYTVQASENGITTLHFSLGDLTFTPAGNDQKITSPEAGTTVQPGMPELPVFSTFFQMTPGHSYSVGFSVIRSHTISDISITPSQPIDFTGELPPAEKDDSFYGQDRIYPLENLNVSEPQVFRGLELLSLSLTPFRYNGATKELEVWDEVEIRLIESAGNDGPGPVTMPRSSIFEKLYGSLVVNYTPRTGEDFQTHAVLYICGGGSNGVINSPYFQQLIEWRHRRGWVVYTAHTGTTGSGNNAIKAYIQNAYETFDPPPEIVGLVGDVGGSYNIPTFYESFSWYNGEGDQPYSLLAGDDILPEVIIGRISVNNNSDVANVLNKTISYEKAVYTGDNWFEKAAVVGDPSDSGSSVADVGLYVASLLENYGFEDVRVKVGGSNWASWMQNQLTEGVLYFHYRGWGLFSGFTNSNISALNNGYKTPFVSFITCGTGSFAGSSMTEYFIRVGTVNNPKGAVTAIGTATLGTHTVFNNIIDMGVWEGIFSRDLDYAGSALANGKLVLYNTYPSDPDHKVSMFTHWNNLMGDPALNLWTDTPVAMTVEHPEVIGLGTNFIPVTITDDEGNPLGGVLITAVTGGDEIFVSRTTDELGTADLPLAADYTGTVHLTATKKNCIPVESTFTITAAGPSVNFVEGSLIFDDAGGNGDGLLTAGETATVALTLRNYGTETAAGISITLNVGSELFTVSAIDLETDELAPGAETTCTFTATLSPAAVDGEPLNVSLVTADSDDHQWTGLLPLEVHAPKLHIAGYSLEDGAVEPGSSATLSLELENLGSVDVDDAAVELTFVSYLIDLPQSTATWGAIPAGGSAASEGAVTLDFSGDIINGTVLTVDAHLTTSGGYDRTEYFSIQIGEVSVTDPLGPDAHGYYIYDSDDLGYSLAHPYDWIEIDPDHNGSGTSFGLTDNGNGNPLSYQPGHLDLPFTFTFYGEDYDEITVSTNGWLAFGNSDMRSFRNYNIPGAGGPSPMVAAFWDDLKTNGGGQVYYQVQDDNSVVIEWSDMHTYDQNSPETFEIILYDSLTPTGDDELLIQYKDFNNTSVGDLEYGGVDHGDYCTVGIENQLGSDGLQYTFNDTYPEAALEISDHTALFITTQQPIALEMGDVNQDGEVNVQDIILVVNHVLLIAPLDTLQAYVADLDQNGVVNILDVIHMINVILGNE
ncbi:MAG: hypothetical protein GXO91_03655 [FCB group bacterium]|nr:hypothetical protein [FCB group bacterium]